MSNFHEDLGAARRYPIYFGDYPEKAGNILGVVAHPDRFANRLGSSLAGECIAGDELTERERDILLMTSLGLCNKVISRRMSISVRTVEHHRSSLRRKLGTGTLSRMEAMVQVLLQTSSDRISELLNIDIRTPSPKN